MFSICMHFAAIVWSHLSLWRNKTLLYITISWHTGSEFWTRRWMKEARLYSAIQGGGSELEDEWQEPGCILTHRVEVLDQKMNDRSQAVSWHTGSGFWTRRWMAGARLYSHLKKYWERERRLLLYKEDEGRSIGEEPVPIKSLGGDLTGKKENYLMW